jgi:hypothetical protein
MGSAPVLLARITGLLPMDAFRIVTLTAIPDSVVTCAVAPASNGAWASLPELLVNVPPPVELTTYAATSTSRHITATASAK